MHPKYFQSLGSAPGGGVAQKSDTADRPSHIPSAPLAFTLVSSELAVNIQGRARRKKQSWCSWVYTWVSEEELNLSDYVEIMRVIYI